MFLLPTAFYAGHAAAMSSPSCSSQHRQPSINVGRGVSGGGGGRQLSHDINAENSGQASDPCKLLPETYKRTMSFHQGAIWSYLHHASSPLYKLTLPEILFLDGNLQSLGKGDWETRWLHRRQAATCRGWLISNIQKMCLGDMPVRSTYES